MKDFLRSRWVLLVVLCVFIAIKIPHLFYPYYWDESWPYAVAVKAMHDNGLSLIPGAISSELSRGHPMLFHVLAAAWMRVFGGSHVAMHAFPLLISLLFLIVIFEAGLRLFSARAAAMALLLVASQEVFIVQSSFLLFEVHVAFLCFLSLWCYVKGRYFLAALFLTMLFYTKESGLVMGMVLGLDALAGLFSKTLTTKEKVFRLLSVGVPCILIGVFFLLQKRINGWYVMPVNTDMIELKPGALLYRFRTSVIFVMFQVCLKYCYFILLVMAALFAAYVRKQPKLLLILVPAICILCFLHPRNMGNGMMGLIFLVFVISWVGFFRVAGRILLLHQLSQRRFIVLSGSFVLVFLCFSDLSFFTYRYMLAALVPLLFVTAVLLDLFIVSAYRWVYYSVLLAIPVISMVSISTNRSHHGDADFGAFNAVAVQQDVVTYLEDNNCYDKDIAGECMLRQHLTDPATGFLRSDKRFKNVRWEIDANTQIAVFDCIEGPDGRYAVVSADTAGGRYRLARRFQRGNVWCEVYEVK